MEQLPKQLAPFFWYFIRPYRGLVSILLITSLIWAIQQSLVPYIFKLIIDTIATYTGSKAAIWHVVKLPVMGYILMWFVISLNYRMIEWAKLQLFPNMRQDITIAMFAYLNRHSHSYLQSNFAGSLSSKIMDMSGSSIALFGRVEDTICNIFAFLIALFSTYWVHPLFAGILFMWTLLFIGISLLFTPKTKILSESFSKSRIALFGKIVDSIGNLSNIRLFARNLYETKRLGKAVGDTVTKDRAMQWYILKMKIFWDTCFILLISGMLGTLIFMYSKGKLSVGDFSFIMMVALNIFTQIWYLASQFVQFAEDLGRCSQALTIIQAPHDVVDALDAKPLVIDQGNIVFDQVTFYYAGRDDLFKNLCVNIESGTKVGLVGFSGSGKTTFVNLILRFFDVQSGCILIDGQDIAKVTQDSLHEQIAMIPQDISLFHRSLMENIRYGRLDATDEEVIEAAKKAYCHEFISSLPEGYEALVGERGIKLSGGQRQRIAVARAMLKNAPILILDEATSALDSVSEKYIYEGLYTLMQGKTVIVIAHRLSTLSQMDRLLVFEKGRIIEDGSHEKLLRNKGLYAQMWQMQANGFLPDSKS